MSVPDDLRPTPHGIAVKFREGQPDGNLWNKPVRVLEERNWDMAAKRTGEEALARKLTRLRQDSPTVETAPLGSVAHIRAGRSYRNTFVGYEPNDAKVRLVSAEDGESALVLLRVADIHDFGVRVPPAIEWLPQELKTQSRIRTESRPEPLRSGDILLTTSGTIGKVGVLDDMLDARAAVAGQGIVVIRATEGVSPGFVRCVLASDLYQKWMRGHARGTTVQHLPISKLRALPVPVPPLELQKRVVSLVPGHRGDPFAAIVRILTNTRDPIAEWLEESTEVRQLRKSEDLVDGAGQLERIATSLRTLRNEVARPGVRTVPELSRWLETVTEPVASLEGLTDIPPGPERLAVLDGVSLQLERIAAPGDPTSPATALAYDVTRRISGLAGLARERILAEVDLQAEVEPGWVAANVQNEIQVRLTNCSPLAFRSLGVFTRPNIGRARTAYLPSDSTLNVPLRIPADAPIGHYRFSVHWRATLLNGKQKKGRMRLAAEVRKSRPADRVREIGNSPYIVGNPIDRKEMLFGRDETLAEIGRQLRSDRANVVLLEGNRRTGKTSILKRLQDPEVLPDWITVNCSLQGGEGHASKVGLPTHAVFRLIARQLGWAAHAAGVRVWIPDTDPPDPRKPFLAAFGKALPQAFSGERPFETFELFLQTVIEAAKPRRILLMLDEFDKLQQGIDAGVTSPQVPENIRYLLHTYPELSAVLVGSRRIKRLREEYWSALFGFGHRIPVGALPLEDARLLVTRPVDGRLVYVPEASDRVVELCARQPFLIQSLCNRLFESATRSRRRTVTVDDVETAAGVMTEDNEHFRTLFKDDAGSERRRFLLALCADLGDRTPATLNLLERRLDSDGVHLHRSERLGDDLEVLRELGLLELRRTRGESEYRLAIPLMAAWMERNVDFEDQRIRAVKEFEEADRGEGFWNAEEDER